MNWKPRPQDITSLIQQRHPIQCMYVLRWVVQVQPAGFDIIISVCMEAACQVREFKTSQRCLQPESPRLDLQGALLMTHDALPPLAVLLKSAPGPSHAPILRVAAAIRAVEVRGSDAGQPKVILPGDALPLELVLPITHTAFPCFSYMRRVKLSL